MSKVCEAKDVEGFVKIANLIKHLRNSIGHSEHGLTQSRLSPRSFYSAREKTEASGL